MMQSDDAPIHVTRVADTVAAPDGATLPPRCIKCNSPALGRPIRYIFVDSDVAGAPTGVFSALLHFSSRRTGRVLIALCSRHRRLRGLIRWGCPILFAV